MKGSVDRLDISQQNGTHIQMSPIFRVSLIRACTNLGTWSGRFVSLSDLKRVPAPNDSAKLYDFSNLLSKL